jgi:hypothetical protein
VASSGSSPSLSSRIPGSSSFASLFQKALGSSKNLPPESGEETPRSPVSRTPRPDSADDRPCLTEGSVQAKESGRANAPPLPKNPRSFDALIAEASQRFGVEIDLIRSVIQAESDFNPSAKSRSGAIGLMQLLPSTAEDLGVNDLYDPGENIFGGTRYLAMLLDRYEGDLKQALAAYNWGPGNVERSPHALPRETEQYVQRVLGFLKTVTT